MSLLKHEQAPLVLLEAEIGGENGDTRAHSAVASGVRGGQTQDRNPGFDLQDQKEKSCSSRDRVCFSMLPGVLG